MHTIVSLLKKNSVYVDVGANIGDTTVIAAAYTKGKIYSFEPSPVAYPRLLENIALNGLTSQIIAERQILTDHTGIVMFEEMGTSETSHINPSKNNHGLRIKSTTLDVYAKIHHLKIIDLIKIDVEGAEMLVLKGAERLLKEHQIKHLFLELNPDARQYGYTNIDTVAYLKQHGYKIAKLPKNFAERIVNIHAYITK